MSHELKYDEIHKKLHDEDLRLRQKLIPKDARYYTIIIAIICFSIFLIFTAVALIFIIITIELNVSTNTKVNNQEIITSLGSKTKITGIEKYQNTRLHVNNNGTKIILRNISNKLEFLEKSKGTDINWDIKKTNINMSDKQFYQGNFGVDKENFNFIVFLNNENEPSVLINQEKYQILKNIISNSIWREVFTFNYQTFDEIYILNVIDHQESFVYLIEVWEKEEDIFEFKYSQQLASKNKSSDQFLNPGGIYFYCKNNLKYLYICHRNSHNYNIVTKFLINQNFKQFTFLSKTSIVSFLNPTTFHGVDMRKISDVYGDLYFFFLEISSPVLYIYKENNHQLSLFQIIGIDEQNVFIQGKRKTEILLLTIKTDFHLIPTSQNSRYLQFILSYKNHGIVVYQKSHQDKFFILSDKHIEGNHSVISASVINKNPILISESNDNSIYVFNLQKF